MSVNTSNPYIYAMLAALIAALLQKRLLVTVVVGMLVFALAKFTLLGGV
jgi:branched-subunit amino acid transport protein